MKNTPASYCRNPIFKSHILRSFAVAVLPLSWHGSNTDEATTTNSLFTYHMLGVIVKYSKGTQTIT